MAAVRQWNGPGTSECRAVASFIVPNGRSGVRLSRVSYLRERKCELSGSIMPMLTRATLAPV